MSRFVFGAAKHVQMSPDHPHQLLNNPPSTGSRRVVGSAMRELKFVVKSTPRNLAAPPAAFGFVAVDPPFSQAGLELQHSLRSSEKSCTAVSDRGNKG